MNNYPNIKECTIATHTDIQPPDKHIKLYISSPTSFKMLHNQFQEQVLQW